MFEGEVVDECPVCDAFDDAFAVFVAGSGITHPDGFCRAVQGAVGFIDNDAGFVFPCLQGGGNFLIESNVAFQRLFHK